MSPRPKFPRADLRRYVAKALRGDLTLVCTTPAQARGLRNALYHHLGGGAEFAITLQHRTLTLRAKYAQLAHTITIRERLDHGTDGH